MFAAVAALGLHLSSEMPTGAAPAAERPASGSPAMIGPGEGLPMIAAYEAALTSSGGGQASEDGGATTLPFFARYEFGKQRRADRLAARHPKAFWISAIGKAVDERVRRAAPTPSPTGTVQVAFTIARDGRLLDKRVVASSGNPALDQTVLALLARAQPFPPMPAGLPDNSMSFSVPVRFR